MQRKDMPANKKNSVQSTQSNTEEQLIQECLETFGIARTVAMFPKKFPHMQAEVNSENNNQPTDKTRGCTF